MKFIVPTNDSGWDAVIIFDTWPERLSWIEQFSSREIMSEYLSIEWPEWTEHIVSERNQMSPSNPNRKVA